MRSFTFVGNYVEDFAGQVDWVELTRGDLRITVLCLMAILQ